VLVKSEQCSGGAVMGLWRVQQLRQLSKGLRGLVEAQSDSNNRMHVHC